MTELFLFELLSFKFICNTLTWLSPLFQLIYKSYNMSDSWQIIPIKKCEAYLNERHFIGSLPILNEIVLIHEKNSATFFRYYLRSIKIRRSFLWSISYQICLWWINWLLAILLRERKLKAWTPPIKFNQCSQQ